MARPWKRGRIAAAAAGLGFVGVLVVAGVFRVEIETRYHLQRLMRDADHFLEIAGEPEGSPEREACKRYVAREGGKMALLRALAAQLKTFSGPGWTDYSLELDSTRSSVIVWVGGTRGGAAGGLVEVHDIHEIFGQRPWEILAWLPALGRGEHTLPEDPATVYGISNSYEGRVGVSVRRTEAPRGVTPRPGAPASTPPSPPSRGTSAG